MPTSTNTLKVIVLVAVCPGSSTLVAVTVTLVVDVTGVGAVYVSVVVPLLSGPDGVPRVAPLTVGVMLHVTAAVLALPSTTAFNVDVCPSVNVLGTALRVMLTAP